MPSDIGLIMNFHALEPMRYERVVVSGFVHRIIWLIAVSRLLMGSAKVIPENNQYPPKFHDKNIHDTLTNIVKATLKQKDEQEEPFQIFLQDKGKWFLERQRCHVGWYPSWESWKWWHRIWNHQSRTLWGVESLKVNVHAARRAMLVPQTGMW